MCSRRVDVRRMESALLSLGCDPGDRQPAWSAWAERHVAISLRLEVETAMSRAIGIHSDNRIATVSVIEHGKNSVRVDPWWAVE